MFRGNGPLRLDWFRDFDSVPCPYAFCTFSLWSICPSVRLPVFQYLLFALSVNVKRINAMFMEMSL